LEFSSEANKALKAESHETIKIADEVKLTGKAAPTVNRYFARLIELGVLIPEGENKGRRYRRKPA
jgi:Fic family protein